MVILTTEISSMWQQATLCPIFNAFKKIKFYSGSMSNRPTADRNFFIQKGFDIRNEPSEQMPKHFLKTCLKSYILFAKDIFHSGARHFKSPPTKKTGDVLINKNNWLCEYKIIETIFRNYENKFDLIVCQY